MGTVNAYLTFGNPKLPYLGKGIYELQLKPSIYTTQQIPVALYGSNNGLQIHISAAAFLTLADINQSIHADIKAGKFLFDPGALPFYIDNAVRYAVWGMDNGADYVSITHASSITAHSPAAGGWNVLLTKLSWGVGMVPKAPGIVMLSHNVYSFGTWKMGVDFYGNLCFTNGVNEVMFGDTGRVIWNGRSVSTYEPDFNVNITDGLDPKKSIYNYGHWNMGVDGCGNLCFMNGKNRVTFYQDKEQDMMLLHSRSEVSGYYISQNKLPVIKTLKNSKHTLSVGTWTIGEDTDGNLCFYNGYATSAAIDGFFFASSPVTTNTTTKATGCIFFHDKSSVTLD